MIQRILLEVGTVVNEKYLPNNFFVPRIIHTFDKNYSMLKKVHTVDKTLEDGRTIEVSVFYKKGTGYTMSAIPVKIEPASIPGLEVRSFMAYSGFNQVISRVNRASKTEEQKAIDSVDAKMEIIINYFKEKNKQDEDF